jgi:phosphohistidine swiveling domain-containing protein
VSADASRVVIDAVRGLGDRIASGEVTPDHYAVRKSDLTVVEQTEQGALSAEDATAIARLVVELERDNAQPVDVECAIARGDLYLLQCRPITTLSNEFTVTWLDPKDAELNWTRDDAHAGRPQPQLMVDLFKKVGAHAMRQLVESFEPPMVPRLETFNGRGYMTMEPRVAREDVSERTRAYQARLRAHTRGLRRRWDEEYLPRLLDHYTWMGRLDFANAPLDDVADAWEELTRRMGDAWAMHMMVTSGAYPIMSELVETYARLTGADGIEALRLTQGMAPTLHRLERDLFRLTQRARSAPAVAAALTAGMITELADLRALGGGPDVAAAILEVIEAYGDLGNAGEDLAGPSWADDHTLLFAELGRRIAAPLEDPEARQAQLLAEGRTVEARVRAELRDRPADLATFEEVLATARAAGPLTEEHNYWLDCKATSQFSRLVRALGARMAREGLLDRPDDIRHLHIDEISAMLRERRDGRPLARERAAEYGRWKRMRAPKTLGSLGAPTASRADLQYRAPRQEDSTIKGIAASSGVGRGAARLVRSTEDFKKMRPGDVLVCRSSNVNWIPLFTIASAVVTDVGGALSHAAVVAREFGVPAVTGVGVAFERLRDGMLVEVDGDRGTVRPL